MALDKKDKEILQLLQKDARMSLTKIAKSINRSIDATHKRIKKMEKEGIFYPTISINPKKIGYELVADTKIKLKNFDQKKYNEFIKYLEKNPFVNSIITANGDYDLTIPIIAKNYNHLDEISLEIRSKFNDIIADWRSAINLKIYKFEYYDMNKL